MKFRKIKYKDVKKRFKEEFDISTNDWELKCLGAANRKFGSWIETKLPLKAAYQVILPNHFHGEKELVPISGLTVKEACMRLRKNKKEYISKCPDCIKAIKKHNKERIGDVYLSQEPVADFGDYGKIKDYKGHFIELNGLHRLLSLLCPSKSRHKFINCYIAVRPSFIKKSK